MSASTSPVDQLPRWSVADVHESLESRSFLVAMERSAAETGRLETLFDELGIRAIPARAVTPDDGRAADQIIRRVNEWEKELDELESYVHATVSTDSYDERAQAVANELAMLASRGRPLLARFVDWIAALQPDELATVSVEASEHLGPLRRLALRAEHLFRLQDAGVAGRQQVPLFIIREVGQEQRPGGHLRSL